MIKVFYDVETTGLEPDKCSIIQLAGYLEKNGEIVNEFDYKLRPHERAVISPDALAVNGVTLEEIMEYPPMEEAFKSFRAMMSLHIDRYDKTHKAWLVGYNNRKFDDPFLRNLFSLCGDKYFGSWFWSDSLDVMVLASQYLLERRHTMPSFKLSRVATELGIVFDEEELHDALGDARITREVYRIVTGLEIEI